MFDKLYFGREYMCRWVNIGSSVELVAGEDLERELFNERDEYVSEEAKIIDESVFFYVPAEVIERDKSVCEAYVRKYLY